jgi:hypothetical protein
MNKMGHVLEESASRGLCIMRQNNLTHSLTHTHTHTHNLSIQSTFSVLRIETKNEA